MQYITISHLNQYIKNYLESDQHLKGIYVVGEISNLKMHYSGHVYLSLKDETSKINAVMFASVASKIKCRLEDGMKVVCRASIGVYPANGAYQLYIQAIEPIGKGDLYAQFEQLKKKLGEQGLFDESLKKQLPMYPKSIGVISAPQGAAIQDVISTIKRRWPICDITLLVSLMQGETAAKDVIEKLKKADNMNFDVIIIARGGGSIEDLWPFNNEELAYLVSECKTPIISAIGHETDFTILDFVSDRRAPTPTGAAEMATPNINDVLINIDQYKKRIVSLFSKNLTNKKDYFNIIKNSISLTSIEKLYEVKMLQVDTLKSRLIKHRDNFFNDIITKINNYQNRLETSLIKKTHETKLDLQNYRNKIEQLYNTNYQNNIKKYQELVAKLDALSPLSVLTRGYSVVAKDNKLVQSVNEVKVNDILTLKVSDGEIETVVKGVKENGKN